MKKYLVYFEFFGKKFKTEIETDNKENLYNLIKERINFLKVETVEEDDSLSFLKNFFNIK